MRLLFIQFSFSSSHSSVPNTISFSDDTKPIREWTGWDLNPVPIYCDRSWFCVACEWSYISKNWTLKVMWEEGDNKILSLCFSASYNLASFV
jgi:hypothetical protein